MLRDEDSPSITSYPLTRTHVQVSIFFSPPAPPAPLHDALTGVAVAITRLEARVRKEKEKVGAWYIKK